VLFAASRYVWEQHVWAPSASIATAPGLSTTNTTPTLAEVAARTILLMQSEAPPGTLAVEVESEGDFPFVVHQAAGMVSTQLGISVADALVRIRAHAFGNDVLVADVARSVVDRRRLLGGIGED
jgi:hypothetical protein